MAGLDDDKAYAKSVRLPTFDRTEVTHRRRNNFGAQCVCVWPCMEETSGVTLLQLAIFLHFGKCNEAVSEVRIEGSPRPRLLPTGHKKILMVLRVSTAVLDIHVTGAD
jgi:hypothetical protein